MRFIRDLKILLICFYWGNAISQSKIDSLERVLSHAKNDENGVEILVKLEREFGDQGKYDRAVECGLRALSICDKNNNMEKAFAVCMDLGYDYYKLLDFKNAEKYELRSISYATKLKNDSLLALGNYYHGFTNCEFEKFEKGLPFLFKAVAIYKRINDENSLIRVYSKIAFCYDQLSDWPKAMEYNFKGLKLCEKLNNRLEATNFLLHIGLLYDYMGDYPKALQNQFKALKYGKESKEDVDIASAYGNIGLVYLHKKDLQPSLKYQLLSEQAYLKSGYEYGIANTRNNIAAVYIQMEKYDSALVYVTRSLETMNKLNSDVGVALCEYNIATIYLNTGKIPEASALAKSSLEKSKKRGIRDHQREVLKLQSDIQKKQGKFEIAMASFESYIALRDSIINEDKKKEMAFKEMKFEFDRKAAVLHAQQEKKNAVAEETKKKQKIVIYAVSGGMVLVLLFAVFILRGYRQKKKANHLLADKNALIEHQKELVEEKNKDILDSIQYARRIQRSLLPTDKYIDKSLKNLKK